MKLVAAAESVIPLECATSQPATGKTTSPIRSAAASASAAFNEPTLENLQ